MSVLELSVPKGRVLIIDDEPELTEGLCQYLELEGLDVFNHSSLITLPFAIRQINPDVILLDLSMPALSGAALFEVGAHRVLRTDAPIILFSGRSARELAALTEELGADGFLAKTTDAEEATRKIAAWILHRRAMKSNGGKTHGTTGTASSVSH